MPAALDRIFPSRLKRADDNDGQDSTYEKAMSDIADIVLRDRAPALKQYEIGFQLIDRDDDDEKAVGVKTFKVGKTWLYAPIFFLGGRVKGTELLYIKDQDIFVPLQEDWIRDILDKQTAPIGRSSPRSLSRLGVSTPDLRQIIRPPTKYGSADGAGVATYREDFLREVLPRWARALTTDPFAGPGSGPGLVAFLKDAGAPAVRALHDLCAACPRIASDLARFHGDALIGAVKEAAARPAAPRRRGWAGEDLLAAHPHPIKTGQLAVLTYDRALGDDGLLASLGDYESADLHARPIVHDTRSDDQVSFEVGPDAERALTNPTETGLYEVLTAPVKYEKCFVGIAPRTTNGNLQGAILARVSDGAYTICHPSRIWVGRKYESPDWDDFVANLPAADTLSGGSESEDYYDPGEGCDVLLGANGNVTAPMRASGPAIASDGGKVLTVWFDVRRDDPAPSSPSGPDQINRTESCALTADRRPRVHVGTGRGTRIWCSEGNMYVPDRYKRLAVRRADGDFVPGSPYHVTLGVVAKTKGLKVACRGGRASVNGREMHALDAFVHLIVDHGFRKAAAAGIMLRAADAEHRPDSTLELRVKYADPYLTDSQPGSPGFPEPWMGMEPSLTRDIPSIPSQYQLMQNPDLMPPRDGASAYDLRSPDDGVLRAVQEAARTGSKEVFDTSIISGILQTTQPDLQVDKYLGALMGGLNAKGRILMNFYWHGDDFAARYGKDDLTSLEDMLRNTFINDGKLILNLKQKGVEDPLDVRHELDLEQASSQ